MTDSLACHYHQESSATWSCDSCSRDYGDCCIPAVPEDAEEPVCPLCLGDMQFHGTAIDAEPFWYRINSFFVYPLRVTSLSFLAVTILISLVMPYAGPLTLPLAILLGCTLTKYSLQIVENVSLGAWEPPTVSEAFSSDGVSLFFKQIGIFLVAGVALYFLARLGLPVLIISACLMLLGIPASIMILAREHSLVSAVNPLKIAFVIASIGWPYLLLYFFLIALYGGPGYIIGFELTPTPMFTAASSFLTGYFSFVMCSMMGYCLYQYQSALGYTTDMSEAEGLSEEDYLRARALADSLIYMREGRESEALKKVKTALVAQPANLELSERYLQLLLLVAPDGAVMKFAGQLITRMLIVKKDYKAIEVYLQVRKKIKSYTPEKPSERLRIAQGLQAKGLPREALRLLINLHKSYPDFDQIPEAYLLVGQLLSESLNNDEQAEVYLNFVVNNYPEHPLAREAQEYRDVIHRLAEEEA